jgi:hypothetical protein
MSRAAYFEAWEKAQEEREREREERREREAREEREGRARKSMPREVFLSLAKEAIDEVEHAIEGGPGTDWHALYLTLFESCAKRDGWRE